MVHLRGKEAVVAERTLKADGDGPALPPLPVVVGGLLQELRLPRVLEELVLRMGWDT